MMALVLKQANLSLTTFKRYSLIGMLMFILLHYYFTLPNSKIKIRYNISIVIYSDSGKVWNGYTNKTPSRNYDSSCK